MRKPRSLIIAAALSTLGMFTWQSTALASGTPSGEVTVGHTTIEPAYDDATGTLVYLSTPSGSAAHINPQFAHNVAPLYLVVYPATSSVGTLNCEDVPVENCPDHGPEVAGAAKSISAANGFGGVYANGVLGHDHLVGIASTGGDYNVLWEPVLVLFKDSSDTNTHVTTLSQIQALGDRLLSVPLPGLTFPCAAVSAAVYNHGTPITS